MKKFKDFDKEAQEAIREAYFRGRRDVERETYVIVEDLRMKLERARAALRGAYIKPNKRKEAEDNERKN